MTRIVVVGSANVDMTVRVARLPSAGETVLGDELSVTAGGKGANQAVAAQRAGGAVTFVGCVGDDALADDALRILRQTGVDLTHVRRVAGTPTGVALITVDPQGENTIAVASGANARLAPVHVEQAADAIERADVLLVQLETPLETIDAALRLAAHHGTRVVLNPAPARALGRALLRQVSVLTPNRAEAARLTGVSADRLDDVADALRTAGPAATVITLGAEGALVVDGRESRRVPAFAARAEDTTGAGDVFNGALAVALGEGRALVDAAHFACAAAALSVATRGAQESAPRRDAIDACAAGGV